MDGIGQGHRRDGPSDDRRIALAALLDPTLEPAPLLARAWLFGTVYLVAGRVPSLGAAPRAGRPADQQADPDSGRRRDRLARGAAPGRPAPAAFEPVGYLDPPPSDMVPDRQAPVLGSPADLGRVVADTGAATSSSASARAGSRADPARQGVRGSRARGVARAAPVRERQRARGSRPPRRPSARPALDRSQGLAVRRQARLRPDRRGDAHPPVAAAARGRRRRPRLAGPDPVPAAADRSRRPPLRDAQVPLDGAAAATRSHPEQRADAADGTSARAASRASTGAPRTAPSSAAPPWTSCSSSTCCAAT